MRMLDRARLLSDDIVVAGSSDGFIMPFEKAMTVRNTNEYYCDNRISKIKKSLPKSLKSIYVPKLGLDSFMIEPDEISG